MEENHVHPEIRKELIGTSVTHCEPWEKGGAKIKFDRSLRYSVIKRLNDKGHVVGGIYNDGGDQMSAFIEPNVL
jgi:hypothetical protein